MAKENIIITSNNDGVIAQKTISNINPAATNAQLAQFGEMIADLTTGQYAKTDRVTKINCDTEPGGGIKPEPTLTLSSYSDTAANVLAALQYSAAMNNYLINDNSPIITTNSDGNLYARYVFPADSPGYTLHKPCAAVYPAGDNLKLAMCACQPNSLDAAQIAGTVYIGVTETDNFAAKEVAFTITN